MTEKDAASHVRGGAPSERWGIIALLFFAMVLNYCDRQMIALLKPILSHELGWGELDYANMIFSFQAAYAGSYLLFGGVVDRIGARAGYAIAFLVWTSAQILHGFARSAAAFVWARALLGAGEGGSYPSSLSVIAGRFGGGERALATGLVNAGVNVGALLTPLAVPVIVAKWGWRGAFIVTGLASLIWVALWLMFVRRRSAGATVTDETAAPPILDLLRHRAVWAYAAAKFLIDPIWWFYLFWLPDYLNKSHGLKLDGVGWPLFCIFLMSDVGNIVGGWLSSTLVRRGVSVGTARKTTLLICALIPILITRLTAVKALWEAVAILSLAAAAHQAFSVNLFTIPSDLFPQRSVGKVIGFGGALGAVGGMFMAQIVGHLLDKTGSFTVIFAVAASMYAVALLILHLATPRYASS